jgi:hypothetical protein
VTLSGCGNYYCTSFGKDELSGLRPDVESRLAGIQFEGIRDYDCDSGVSASLEYSRASSLTAEVFGEQLKVSGCALRKGHYGEVLFRCAGEEHGFFVSYVDDVVLVYVAES